MTSRSTYPIVQLLEQRSKFFCPAKWTELYLYLNHGNSNSCHHPIPHRIPIELLDNPEVLHNTPHKLKMQQLMIDGHRPEECHMCWHIEDLDPDVLSDRIHKSEKWKEDISTLNVAPNHIPRLIEVVFDNVCNLKCSYCDSGSSSVWANEITQNPIILKTDHRKLYYKLALSKEIESDKYFDAWLSWWPTIKNKVEILKISGGEPLLSKKCWRFIDDLDYTPQLDLAINSNLSYDQSLLDKLINKAKNFKIITISASLDATGDIAEFSRQGLDYNKFVSNIEFWCEHSPDNCFMYLQSTTNIFSIWGLTDMIDLSIRLKKNYPNKIKNFYSTIVRFPEFQSISLLPTELKTQLSTNIQEWFLSTQHDLSDIEKSYVEKIIVYLTHIPQSLYPLPVKHLQQDLKKFVSWYEQSSKLKFKDVYPTEFVEWLYQIE